MSKCLLCQTSLQERRQFLDILFLKKTSPTLCVECHSQFEPISNHTCPSCCKVLLEEGCQDCFYWQAQGKKVDHTALYHYNEKMMDYFSRYKFQGDYLLRKIFAREIRTHLTKYKDYTIVPIPISSQRMEERGFNQVSGLLDAAGIIYQPILEKNHTAKQSEKNRQERLKTKQAFYIEEKRQVPEKIILVDDIYTTGTTLQLAKGLLMKNGAKTIKTFSLAR